MASITLFGDKDYRIGTQSISTSLFKMKEAKTFIQDEIENLNDREIKIVITGNVLIGQSEVCFINRNILIYYCR